MLRHLIWDFDGTLFDTYPALVTAYQKALEAHGFSAPYEEIHSLMRRSVDTAFSYYRETLGVGDEILRDYSAIRAEIEPELAKPYPGMPELLRDISSSGRHSYLCTHRGGSVYALLEKFGLRDLFSDFVTAEDGFPRKPDPAGVRCLMEKHAIAPEEAAMIGDRTLDVRAGQNAGILGVGYCDGTGEDIACADVIVRDVAALRAFLELEKDNLPRPGCKSDFSIL